MYGLNEHQQTFNLSDKISRDKWDVVAELHAEVITIDMSEVYKEFILLSASLEHAMEAAACCIPKLIDSQLPAHRYVP